MIQQARIIIVILDNATTAMTGGQPVPHMGVAAGGQATRAVAIEPLVKASGVDFLEVCDPYDQDSFAKLLLQADAYTRSPEGGVAVLIARHGCVMDRKVLQAQQSFLVTINDKCIACRKCVDAFECPALLMDDEGNMALVNQDRCVGCGTCLPVCPVDAIVKEEKS